MTAIVLDPLPAAAGRCQKLLVTARARLADIWSRLARSPGHMTWIALWSVLGIVGTAASPLLVNHPVLLMALAPRALFVALAAGQSSLLTFVLIGVIRLSITDASYYLIGKRFSEDGSSRPRRAPRWKLARRFFDMARRSNKLAAVVLFLRPNAKFCAFAGAQRIPAWLAASATVAGTLAYLTAVHSGVGFVA